MARHRLRPGALDLAPWHSQRDHLDCYHGLLGGPDLYCDASPAIFQAPSTQTISRVLVTSSL